MENGTQQLGKYTLRQKIATGGMAEIWLSEQQGPGGFTKELVIKRILPHLASDARFVEMFLDEARLAAKLSHPNIVQIYDLGEADGSYFIAMQYIKGNDLEGIINQCNAHGERIDPPMAARIMADACAALDYAHSFADGNGNPLNLVHRDISPQNILVSEKGVVKLVDFGVAKAASSSHVTQAGAVKGKFCYMSPEQIASKPLDGRSDLFAMGIVLYELLTGRRPFGHESDMMAVTAILNQPPPPPQQFGAQLPQGLESVLFRSLENSLGALPEHDWSPRTHQRTGSLYGGSVRRWTSAFRHATRGSCPCRHSAVRRFRGRSGRPWFAKRRPATPNGTGNGPGRTAAECECTSTCLSWCREPAPAGSCAEQSSPAGG